MFDRPSPRPRGTRALALAAGALVVLGALAPAAATAATPAPSPAPSDVPVDAGALASFGISPAGPQAPDDRSFLQYTAAPGSVLYDHVAVLNQAADPVDLDMTTGDVVMSGGSLAVRAGQDDDTDAGAWLALDPAAPTVHVPAQSAAAGVGYVVVPFSVTIPANAEPGDHVAGIVASLTTTGQGGSGSPAVRLEQRVAARVYVRVAGELRPGLAVDVLRVRWLPGGLVASGDVEVTYALRNTGNVRVAVEPSVAVSGPFGWARREATGERVDELLPGAQAQVTAVVHGVPPLVRERVTVHAAVVAAPAAQDPGLGAVEGSGATWAVPWLAVALVALVVVGVVVVLVRRARRGGSGTPPAARHAADRTPVGAR